MVGLWWLGLLDRFLFLFFFFFFFLAIYAKYLHYMQEVLCFT